MSLNEGRLRAAGLLPSLGLAVLSKFTCSFCLAAYSGLLASVGVGFVATDSGLTILTVALLALGIASVAWSTRRHRSLGPLAMVFLGSATVLAARLAAPSTRFLLGGALLIIAGSAWNLLLERTPACCADAIKSKTTETTQ